MEIKKVEKKIIIFLTTLIVFDRREICYVRIAPSTTPIS